MAPGLACQLQWSRCFVGQVVQMSDFYMFNQQVEVDGYTEASLGCKEGEV